jgi:hypothetical protein
MNASSLRGYPDVGLEDSGGEGWISTFHPQPKSGRDMWPVTKFEDDGDDDGGEPNSLV